MGTILDITEHKKNQERIDSLTRALIKAQETERRKLALDLHDEVAQQLSALTFFLESLRQGVSPSQPEMRQEIAKISGIAQRLVEYVRNLAYSLRPPMLDRHGLVPTLSQYCSDYSERNGIRVDFFPLGMEGVALDFDTEINLFRITQEALTNVRKHASARQVTIKLQAKAPNIILSIRDDGNGFDVRKEMRDSGQRKMGLSGIEQRASLLGGRLSIQSGRGKGSRILVEVPLREKTNEGQEENTHR
jgi:signal transduction histidine kinase